MPSPFPGMDPYLEGYLWPDVHTALANKIRQLLVPQLKPRYVARLEVAVVQDSDLAAEIGIVDPVILLLESIEMRLVTVEVRDVAHHELVTCIEILSPINKREPSLIHYRQKRARLHQIGVHLLEIDLLRRGTHPLAYPRLPVSSYLITLTRAHVEHAEVWPLQLQDSLPVVPVPLRAPDPDVPLELSTALVAIYDEAAYDLSIDYSQPPPPPPLSPKDAAWLEELLARPG